MPGPRDYTPSTLKRLHMLSGNECAAPDCNKTLIARDGHTLISKICHIEAADKKGPRYRKSMTDDERRCFDNLILLCDECHNMVDNFANEEKYTVSLLKQWKTEHEGLYLSKLASNPSLIKDAVIAISKINFDGDLQDRLKSPAPFNIEEKILYNDIKYNKSLIDEYKVFYPKINALYNELENQGTFKKEKLLRYIHQTYLRIKGLYIGASTDQHEIIKKNSDNIIEDVLSELLNAVTKDGKSYQEDVEFCISIVMVDAFMRCKILEEPK